MVGLLSNSKTLFQLGSTVVMLTFNRGYKAAVIKMSQIVVWKKQHWPSHRQGGCNLLPRWI